MTLCDGIVLFDDLNKIFIVFRVVEPYIYKSRQFPAEKLVVDKNRMLLYNARTFKLFYAFNYSRSGKINLLADWGRILPWILLQAG